MEKPAKKIVVIFSVAILILLTVFFVWLLTGQVTDAKKQVLNFLPLPVMLIDSAPVSSGEFFERLDFAENSGSNGQNYEELKAEIKNRIIYEHKIKALAWSLKISVSEKQTEKAYWAYKQSFEQASGSALEQALAERNVSADYFKEQILSFNELLKNIKVWYNGKRNLNEKAYRTADFLMEEVKNGTDFAGLASLYSQDADGKQFEGDSGFVEIYKLLPELQEKIDAAGAGDILLLPSSLGLHIIKIENKDTLGEGGTPRAHIREIFIETPDFNQWLETQIKNYKTINLINL